MKLSRIFAFLLVGLFAVSAHAVKKNDDAPDFELNGIAGGKISLSDYKGKVVYVDFWASWCPPCLKSLPMIDEYHSEVKDQGFEVIAINLDEDVDDAESFLTKNPVHYAVAVDPEGKTPKMYNVQAMPTSYMIDKKGKIRYVHKGFKPKDMKKIQEYAEKLLAE